jgi:hypothetical protein
MATHPSVAKEVWKPILLGIVLSLISLGSANASSSLEEIKRCRSIIAEAALLVELWSKGNVTDIFADNLLAAAEEELKSAADNPDIDAAIRTKLHAASSAIEARNDAALTQLADELYAREMQNWVTLLK